MTIEVAVEITIQACRGLSAAHGETPPIIHRDIKPQNLLIGYDGAGLRVRITDFGLAKQVNPLTMLASARGTLLFKAPETVSDFHQDSTSGDVWALGTTLYLLSTDQLPYPPDPRDVSVEPKRFDKALVPAHTFNIRIDPHLEAILTRSLARDPRDRYPHAMAFLQDLEAWSAARTDRIAAPSGVMAQQTSKDALGHHDAANEGQARSKAQKARDLARQAATIGEAADLLEEALAQWPPLKDEYEYELKLWRRGVAM
jgi:serine/threonine-protein kinase